MKRGSALILALWTIAVLSVMVIAFAYEARQQKGINVYVQRRNRASHLIDAGKILAEIVLLDYKNAKEWSQDEDAAALLEDDAWYEAKRDLKTTSKCTVGPVCLDETYPESALVMVEIEASNSRSKGVININELYQGSDGTSDKNVDARWWMIFRSHNIPEELDTERDGRIKLWNILIASWKDWRDSDDTVTSIDGEECGAEDEWYEEMEKKFKNVDEDVKNELKRRPRNGPIPDIHELAYVRGFRDYPQVLTGGVINPWADEKERIEVKGIMDLFCTEGPLKINVNNCRNLDTLVTIPGIFDKTEVDRDDVLEEAMEVAQAIVDTLGVEPDDDDVNPNLSSWPYKDWSDMLKRIENNGDSRVKSSDIGSEAKEYLSFALEDDAIFKVKITVESDGMQRVCEAECYVKDNKVRYVKWVDDIPQVEE